MGGLKLLKTRARVAASFWHAPKSGALAKLRAQGLEVAEVRLDLANITTPKDAAALMKHFSPMPSIATMRSAAEGGKWRGDDKTRHAILKAALHYADAADIELAAPNRAAIAKTARTMGKSIILSRHNFAGVDAPEEMDALANKILKPNATTGGKDNKDNNGGTILKIAALVGNAGDLRVMEEFLRRWRHYPVIVIGMGESASAKKTRQTFPHQGSKLAFAAIDKKSAPGQLSLRQTIAAARPLAIPAKAPIAHS